MSAIISVPLFGAAGMAVDYSRANAARAQVDAAADAAVLAGTQNLVETEGNKEKSLKVAATFFKAEIKNISLIHHNDIKFVMNADNNGIDAIGTVKIKTGIMGMMGFADMTVPGKSGAIYADGEAETDLEISLMLDVTGSMCSDGAGPCTSSSKMGAMKSAAKQLVDKVVSDDQSKFTTKIAIIPFATNVRVAQDGAGSSVMNKLTDLGPNWSGWKRDCSSSSGGSTGGSETGGGGGPYVCHAFTDIHINNHKLMPCVTDRHYDSGMLFELTDTKPGPGIWLNAHNGSRKGISEDSADTPMTSGLGITASDPSTQYNYNPGGTCHDSSNSNEVLPLSSNKSALNNKIDSLQAYGSTSGALGTAFAWYMLSPNWKTIWTGQSQPKDYSQLTAIGTNGKPKLRKIAILMTDGAYNTFRGWKDKDINEVSAAAVSLCDGMKAKGIEVFTVGFELDSLSTYERNVATNTLQSCGSSIGHFYQSLNNAQLSAAFENIGDKLSSSGVRFVK